MTWELVVVLFGLAGTCCSIIFGIAAFRRNQKTDEQQDGRESGTILSEIGYIKANTDDIKRKQEKQDEQYLRISERVTAVEASAKQAHHRLDRLENLTDNPPD